MKRTEIESGKSYVERMLPIGARIVFEGNGILQYTTANSSEIDNGNAVYFDFLNNTRVKNEGISIKATCSSGKCYLSVEDGDVDNALSEAINVDSNGFIRFYGHNGEIKFPRTLIQFGVPIGIPGSGSIGANGSLTLNSAVNLLAMGSSGIYFYFPSNALYSGSVAGFYYTVLSSTTTGTVYNNVLNTLEAPAIPESLTQIVSGSIGAFTSTTSEVVVSSFVLPANSMGKNGRLKCSYSCEHNASANHKIFTVKLNNSIIEEESFATSDRKSSANVLDIINRGRPDRQTVLTANGYNVSYGSIQGTSNYISVDTTQNVVVNLSLKTVNSADFLVLLGFSAELIPM